MINEHHKQLSIRYQCELLSINRSSLYYQPQGVKEDDHRIMRLLDEQYTKTPYYGVERMTAWLHRCGIVIGHNRVRRLLRLMGLEAIYPKPRLSTPGGPEHTIYPYLLRNLNIDHVNHVWATDITYIRLSEGFVYLVAVLDWYSRYVLSWSLSNSLDSSFCCEALRHSLAIAKPDIFNSDQGSQFTSTPFTSILKDHKIRISMDGRGRCFDNIFTERLWRTVKHEEVYLKDYQDVHECRESLGCYFHLYNNERIHESLGYKTPSEVYYGYEKDFSMDLLSKDHVKK